MSTFHARSVFTNSCLSTPRKKGTLRYQSHSKPEDQASTSHVHAISRNVEQEISPSSIEGNERYNDNTGGRKEYAALFSTLLESNALLLEEIRALKHEQQSALYVPQNDTFIEEDRLTQSLPPQLPNDIWVTPSTQSPSLISRSVISQEEDDGSTWNEVVEDIEPTDMVHSESEYSESTVVSSMDSLITDPFASPGAQAVHSMWDNFSVDDYRSLDSMEAIESPKGGKKEWTPKITVPEPFSMTVRESQTPKQKSRSLKMAEQEHLKKTAEAEAELMKKFRASPVPASTFLPLYELVNAKNEQRKEEVKRLSKDYLKATERPFSFAQREQELLQIKRRQAALLKQIENKERKENIFKAKPVPKNLFSPVSKEYIREQEEYRKIRTQMRSEELLASSKLPKSMKLRCQPQHVSRKEPAQREERDHLFHPSINSTVPDYDQAYYEFQKKLAAKRNTKQTTITEPFFFHTKRKQQIVNDMQRESQKLLVDRWQYAAPRAKVSRQSPRHNQPKPAQSIYPAQMTQTALLRRSLTQEKLTNVLQNELQEQEQNAKRKRQAREIKKYIAEKSDSTGWLEEKKEQKLRDFQKQDREKQEKYQLQLNEMQERVQSRPLLQEQASLLSPRTSAEAKCRVTLKKAGLSEQDILALEHQ